MTTTTPPTRRVTSPAALDLVRAYDWRDDASCNGIDGELFFPVAHTKGWRAQTAQAKTVCARCPVRQACLDYALDTGQKAGVWGGLTETERQRLRELPETQSERCWNNRAWIEARLAEGVQQRQIAEELRVTRRTLCRVIAEFAAEALTADGTLKVVKAA